MFPITLDVLIVGGGIAGLWLLDECRRSGYDVLLLESKALGSGQTIASQGILHGGLKYSLARASNGFINNIKKMPPIWQACLSGLREPNISSVRLRGKSVFHQLLLSWLKTSGRFLFGIVQEKFCG